MGVDEGRAVGSDEGCSVGACTGGLGRVTGDLVGLWVVGGRTGGAT